MAQRKYSKRVIVAVFVDDDDQVEAVEICEQRWGKVPHLVTFHDVGPFPLTRDVVAQIEAGVQSSLLWLVEDLTEGAVRRML